MFACLLGPEWGKRGGPRGPRAAPARCGPCVAGKGIGFRLSGGIRADALGGKPQPFPAWGGGEAGAPPSSSGCAAILASSRELGQSDPRVSLNIEAQPRRLEGWDAGRG